MYFKGDLSKYHPADALMFLANLNMNGIFSVASQQSILTLSFREGMLLDAQSAAGDQKILNRLQFKGLINDAQRRKIQQIQTETGLSVRQILAQLKLFDLKDIKTILVMGVFEVLLQLFLLESGTFNFTDTALEADASGICLETGKAALKVLAQSDELRDFEKTHVCADRAVEIAAGQPVETASVEERIVLKLAEQKPTIRQLLNKGPLPTYQGLKIVEDFLSRGILALRPAGSGATRPAVPALDPIFAAYRQAVKKLIGAGDVLNRLEAIVSFCKLFYDGMLIFTARQRDVIHCKLISMDAAKGLSQKSIKAELGSIDSDPVFAAVHSSRVGFFGQRFPSTLLGRVLGQDGQNAEGGECALIPIHVRSDLVLFLYAYAAKPFSGLSAHHYLELLSWMITPALKISEAQQPPGPESAAAAGRPADSATGANPAAGPVIADLIARIEDLPPLPSLVSRALTMLADPETPIEEIEKLIGQDQALVAKLIKVGNSALYSGYQKVATLRQVLTRLGAKTTRSLILTSSTRSFFLKNRQGMRMWGQFLWQHALECGLAARRVAAALAYADPDEAFVSGIVHDVGKLVLLMLFPEKYREVQKLRKVSRLTDKAAELQIMGMDHEQVGRLLMEKWKMPDTVKACTEFHHRFRESGPHQKLAAIVAYANHLSHLYGTHPQPVEPQENDQALDLIAFLGLSQPAVETLVSTVLDDFQNADLMN